MRDQYTTKLLNLDLFYDETILTFDRSNRTFVNYFWTDSVMLELTAINSPIQETDNDFMEHDDNSLFLFTTHFIETKFTTDRTCSTELKNL